jgi:hypothetical protein
MLKLTALHGWSYTAEVPLEIPSVQPVGRKRVPTVLSYPSARVDAFGEPRGLATSRCSPLHGAYLHVADEIGQHFYAAKQNDKRHQAENNYCQHGAPRDYLNLPAQAQHDPVNMPIPVNPDLAPIITVF